MAKKASKFFRIGVEGDTCDGRVISAQDIQEMAETFDPRVYGCRTGRADIYTETPVKVSGFKRVIDEQDWTITKVTHFLNNSGFTTSLELEVRLSDVEYETEDNE